MERRYAEKYGELPDTTFIKLYEQGTDSRGDIINERMNLIWQEMKAEHEEQLRQECPFLT